MNATDISSLLPPSLNLPTHLSAHKYFFVCTLTVAAWDTLVLSPRSWRLLKTKEWPVLKIIFNVLRFLMPAEFIIVGQFSSIIFYLIFAHFLHPPSSQPLPSSTQSSRLRCATSSTFLNQLPLWSSSPSVPLSTLSAFMQSTTSRAPSSVVSVLSS